MSEDFQPICGFVSESRSYSVMAQAGASVPRAVGFEPDGTLRVGYTGRLTCGQLAAMAPGLYDITWDDGMARHVLLLVS